MFKRNNKKEGIDRRKLEHIEISITKDVESEESNGFEDIILIHRALPQIDFNEIDVKTVFLGREISMPIVIAGMTGGHKKAKEINKNLAIAAEKLNIPLGVGSQRAALEKKELEDTFSVVRDYAPNAFVIANIGIVQFCVEYTVEHAEMAVEMIGADAIALHLNPLQEILQEEGDRNFSCCLDAIREIKKSLNVPVIVKETGAGISLEDAVLIEKAGADAIDVGGLGGTNFAKIEFYRNNNEKAKLFFNWGIKTAISLIECLSSTNIPIIATGGIRNGLEVAKSIALGAIACGIALPFLKKAVISSQEVLKEAKKIEEELKMAMFLTGSKNIEELKKVNVIIKGFVKEWLDARGIEISSFARRR